MLDANTPARPTGPLPDTSWMFNQPRKRVLQTTRRIPGVELPGPALPPVEADLPRLTDEQIRSAFRTVSDKLTQAQRELLELRGRHDALEARLAELERGGPA